MNELGLHQDKDGNWYRETGEERPCKAGEWIRQSGHGFVFKAGENDPLNGYVDVMIYEPVDVVNWPRPTAWYYLNGTERMSIMNAPEIWSLLDGESGWKKINPVKGWSAASSFTLVGIWAPQPERWRAEKLGAYYFVYFDMTVMGTADFKAEVDDDRYKVGNYFQTEKEAQEMADKIKKLLRGES